MALPTSPKHTPHSKVNAKVEQQNRRQAREPSLPKQERNIYIMLLCICEDNQGSISGENSNSSLLAQRTKIYVKTLQTPTQRHERPVMILLQHNSTSIPQCKFKTYLVLENSLLPLSKRRLVGDKLYCGSSLLIFIASHPFVLRYTDFVSRNSNKSLILISLHQPTNYMEKRAS